MGYTGLMSATGEVLRVLPGQIRSLARRAVMEELKQIDLASIALSAESDTGTIDAGALYPVGPPAGNGLRGSSARRSHVAHRAIGCEFNVNRRI